MKVSYRTRSAFTLIEVLLVTAILLSFTAVMYAAFGPVRERARRTTCMSNLRQIGQALAMYRTDMDGSEASVGTASSCSDLGLPCTEYITSFFEKYKIEKQMRYCSDYKGQHGKVENLTSTYIWPMGGNDSDLPDEHRLTSRTLKSGDSTVVVFDDSHNRLFDFKKEPNWTQKRVLVLRLNGQVDSLMVPYQSTNVDW